MPVVVYLQMENTGRQETGFSSKEVGGRYGVSLAELHQNQIHCSNNQSARPPQPQTTFETGETSALSPLFNGWNLRLKETAVSSPKQ